MAKILSSVVVFLTVASLIAGWYFNRPTAVFVDPFAGGTEETLAEAGLPVIGLYDPRYAGNINSISRYVIVEVDPGRCPTASTDCVKEILDAQPWIIDLEVDRSRNEHQHLEFEIRDGGKRCGAYGGPVDEDRRKYMSRQLRPKVPDDLTGIWEFSFECPIRGEFLLPPGDDR